MKRLVLKSIAAAVAFAAFGLASAQERIIKFGVAGPDTHPAAVGMKAFAEAVAAKSGGKMKVNLFFNSALGGDQQVVSAIKGGTVEMSVMNSGILASEAKELAIFDFPFLFANEKESDAIVDGPIGRKMHALLEAKGIVGLSYWELGYRHMTNSTASNSSRLTTSRSLRIRSAWVRNRVSNSRRTPWATPAASFISRATSSKNRLLVWVIGVSGQTIPQTMAIRPGDRKSRITALLSVATAGRHLAAKASAGSRAMTAQPAVAR